MLSEFFTLTHFTSSKESFRLLILIFPFFFTDKQRLGISDIESIFAFCGVLMGAFSRQVTFDPTRFRG